MGVENSIQPGCGQRCEMSGFLIKTYNLSGFILVCIRVYIQGLSRLYSRIDAALAQILIVYLGIRLVSFWKCPGLQTRTFLPGTEMKNMIFIMVYHGFTIILIRFPLPAWLWVYG